MMNASTSVQYARRNGGLNSRSRSSTAHAYRPRIENLESRVMLAIDFDWETPPRFAKVDAYTGIAGDSGRYNVPNTFSYAQNNDVNGNPIGYTIQLTANLNLNTLFGERLIGSPSWTISGGTLTGTRTATGTTATFTGLDLGPDFQETFTVQLNATVTRFVSRNILVTSNETSLQDVTLRDILIVSMGDSYSAGEGMPEFPNENNAPPFGINGQPATWEDSAAGVNSAMEREHRLGHRSTKAFAAQAARRIEEGDFNNDGVPDTDPQIATFAKQTAVTFVHVAMTGATVDAGLLNPQYPLGKNVDGQHIFPPSQLDMIQSIVGDRPIDSLIFSIGVNETDFGGQLVKLLARAESNTFGNTSEESIQGWNTLPDIQRDAEHRLSFLPEQYRRLDEAVRSRLNVRQMTMVAYPSPVRRGVDNYQTAFDDLIVKFQEDLQRLSKSSLFDIFGTANRAFTELVASFGGSGIQYDPAQIEFLMEALTKINRASTNASLAEKFNVSRTELQFADERIFQPMNRLMQNSARLLGWNFIGDGDDPILAESNGKGYGGLNDNRPPDQRWFITYEESLDTQGDFGGILHPNLQAHRRVADFVVENVMRPVARFSGLNGFDRTISTTLQPSQLSTFNTRDGAYLFPFQTVFDRSRPNRLNGGSSDTLDGTPIDHYEWDMNYDGNPNNFRVNATGINPVFPHRIGHIPRLIGLRVVDAKGRTSQISRTLVAPTPATVPATTALGPINDPIAYVNQVGQLVVFGYNSGLPGEDGSSIIHVRQRPRTNNQIQVSILGGGFTSPILFHFRDHLFNHVIVDGQSGNDRIQIQANLRISPASGLPLELPNTRAELLEARLLGGLGHDTLIGGSGHDVLLGGPGNDSIIGGDGNDLIRGGTGNDTIHGGLGDDTIYGDGGHDLIFGDGGHDLIFGGTGNDTIYGGAGNDTLEGGSGHDLIFGGPGDDILRGNSGNDTLLGGPGDDLLEGGTGDDFLMGGPGIDKMLGGPGNDLLGIGPAIRIRGVPIPGLSGAEDSNDYRPPWEKTPWWTTFSIFGYRDVFDGGPGVNGVAITGTPGDDVIHVSRRVDEEGLVYVVATINGVVTEIPIMNCQTMIVDGLSGNDIIVMDNEAIKGWRAEFYGGSGYNVLSGTPRDGDILDGGQGPSLIFTHGANATVLGQDNQVIQEPGPLPLWIQRRITRSMAGEPLFVEGDFDGDGITDLALYHYDDERSVGVFTIQFSGSRENEPTIVEVSGVGPNVIPVTGDFDGDGLADLVVVDPLARLGGSEVPNASVWYLLLSSDNWRDEDRLEIPFGAAGALDRPAPADFDGDGITDIATFRADSDLVPGAAQWFVLPSRANPRGFHETRGAFSMLFGAPGGTDLPAPADFDGDGIADIVTFRPVSDLVPGAAQWFVLPSSLNAPPPDAPPGTGWTNFGAFSVTFGASGNADQPAVADFDGDGRDDIVVSRSESDLTPGSGQWFILPSEPNPTDFETTDGGFSVVFGEGGSIAAVGSYNRIGRPDLAVFNHATGVWVIRDGSSIGAEPPPEEAIRTETFGPTGSGVVPLLAPLFFRLMATGNPTGAGAAGGPAAASLSLSGSSDLRASRRIKLFDEALIRLLDDD